MRDKRAKYIRNYATLLVITLFVFGFTFSQSDVLARPSIKTVVIDAGHGGKDPGCHGASAQEKHVCLSMALKLGKMITAKYPKIKVIYTRDSDVFVELDERAKIANRNKADLFICIHANAAAEVVYGAETYVLGLHKTEAQQLIAERENSTIYLEEDKGAKYNDFDLSPDAIIARQIQLSVFLDQSISFASKVQQELKNIGRSDRGVKQAGFLVLYKTTMPSILIETGFLTNRKEEVFLSDTASQRKMSGAMFTAFESYRNELEGIAGNKTTTPVKTDGKGTRNPFDENVETPVKETVVIKNPVKTKDPVVEVLPQPEVKIPPVNPDKDQVIFRVQIETSAVKVTNPAARFKGMEVYEYKQDQSYKYTAGKYINDYSGATAYKNELKKNGYEYAFIVAFLNGERISIEKAINLAKK